MIQSLANFPRRRQQKWNSGQMLSILAHSSLEVHCSYRLKFFVANNHLKSSSPSNCGLFFCSIMFTTSFLRSKYTEGVALCMYCCPEIKSKVRPKKKWERIYSPKLEHAHVMCNIFRGYPTNEDKIFTTFYKKKKKPN